MSSAVDKAIAREFGDYDPDVLIGPINARLKSSYEINDIVSILVDEDAVLTHAAAAAAMRRWDAEDSPDWAAGTTAKSRERRVHIYNRLGIPVEGHSILDEAFPAQPGPVVIAAQRPWAPWYTSDRRMQRDFYWRAYKKVLKTKFDGPTLGRLDEITNEVVSRLADPTRVEPYQSKGLVVGYVQSGKTANFTGVIAKAVDAGYRLVIVLTGTIELLRSQTQRRLDMELVGKQNIGSDGDYFDDAEWETGFVDHELDPNISNDVPAIRRLTGQSFDFHSLGKGLPALTYEFVDHGLPLNDPKNLFASDIRIAVVKKNSIVLKKLVDDLRRIPTKLDQIPTLIIDDESDQASVNTLNPEKFAADSIERTAINGRIADLLEVMKRAQYIGYTATPFANVFVDPVDSESIFPKDFIVSLDRPGPYMGGRDFHDFEDDYQDENKSPSNSNEKAFVRDLIAGIDDDGRTIEQRQALDSFVLSGAIKCFRESRGAKPFRHHTMLVHESVKQAEHKAVAEEFRSLWKSGGYSQPSGLARLEKLWESDFRVVSAARPEAGVDSPGSFEDLDGFIGAAVDKIAQGTSPVIVVNGEAEKDYAQDALDFQGPGVWKILVGGAKLSRGFTVEGLTITYYTRRTPQADTLMQMGRWFGFRQGYRDLVRLFIGRNVPGPAGKPFDMYEAFETIVKDEEEFRKELERFASRNESGEPMVTPKDVPPMVFQSQPWLKPTSANKMYNAEQAYRGVGGEAFSFTMQPPRGPNGENNRRHFGLVAPLLDALGEDPGEFNLVDARGLPRPFAARYGIVDASTVYNLVSEFEWDKNWTFEPHQKAMESAIERKLLTDFVILLPQPKTRQPVQIADWPVPLPIVNRKRQDREYRTGFTGTAVRERDAIEHIAGSKSKNGGALAESLRQKTRGALILVFASDPPSSRHFKKALTGPVDPRDVATLFSYALPYAAEPKPRIGFRVKTAGAGAIVDAE
ncbi:Z1 domain-containing protein [Actinomycetes bacterium M1A6_2h]